MMMSRTKIVSVLFLVVTLTLSASAFTTSNGNGIISKSNHQVGHGSMRVCSSSSAPISTRTSNTALSERRWNFNEGQSPWGLKKNAEIWNGRMAQMAFVWVFLQELITGKGVFKGIEEGDLFFVANLGLAVLSMVGLTAWLAIKGDDDYTKDV